MTDAVEAARRLIAGDPTVMGWEAVAIARALLAAVEREKRLREALQDIWHVTGDSDNYGPHDRPKAELLRRLKDIQAMAAAALASEQQEKKP